MGSKGQTVAPPQNTARVKRTLNAYKSETEVTPNDESIKTMLKR